MFQVHLVECQVKKRRRGRRVGGEGGDGKKLLQSREVSHMKLEPFDKGMHCEIADAVVYDYFLRFSKIVALFVLRFQAALEALLSLICHSPLPDMSRNCCR